MTATVSNIMDRMTEPVLDRYTRTAIRSELNRWGRWIERHADYEGFAPINYLMAAREGRGGGMPGHRVLCLDMPVHIYAVHGRVLRLTEEQRYAVHVEFVIKVKEDGTIWRTSEKCEKIGMKPWKLRDLVEQAMVRIAGL